MSTLELPVSGKHFSHQRITFHFFCLPPWVLQKSSLLLIFHLLSDRLRNFAWSLHSQMSMTVQIARECFFLLPSSTAGHVVFLVQKLIAAELITGKCHRCYLTRQLLKTLLFSALKSVFSYSRLVKQRG